MKLYEAHWGDLKIEFHTRRGAKNAFFPWQREEHVVAQMFYLDTPLPTGRWWIGDEKAVKWAMWSFTNMVYAAYGHQWVQKWASQRADEIDFWSVDQGELVESRSM